MLKNILKIGLGLGIIASLSNAETFKKGADKPKNEGPTYSFVGSDHLDGFPSDYLGKKVYLICKKSRADEDSEGGYKVMPLCANSDGKYGFMSMGLKVKIHTNDKDVAKQLVKSEKQEKLLMGTVKKNTAKYSMYKHVFEIEEVQYK